MKKIVQNILNLINENICLKDTIIKNEDSTLSCISLLNKGISQEEKNNILLKQKNIINNLELYYNKYDSNIDKIKELFKSLDEESLILGKISNNLIGNLFYLNIIPSDLNKIKFCLKSLHTDKYFDTLNNKEKNRSGKIYFEVK